MTPRERAEATAARLFFAKTEEEYLQMLEEDFADYVRALLADDEVEAIICAIGVKHQLNIHPAIARDIAAALRRKAGV